MGSCRRYLLERHVYLRASCVPILKAKGGGKIVNIASIAGHRGTPGGSAYSAAKGGVINLTRQMAVELGQFKMNGNSVSPGFTPTRLTTIYEYQEGARDERAYGGAASGSNFTAAPLGSRGELTITLARFCFCPLNGPISSPGRFARGGWTHGCEMI